MKENYASPKLEVLKLTSEDILNQSDVLINGGSLFDTTDDSEE